MTNPTNPSGHQNTRNKVAKSRARGRDNTSPQAIARWERDVECVRMRRAQCDWETIVAKLGYSSAGHAHDRFLAVLRSYPRDDVQAMRDLEADRLEEAGNALWDRIHEGDSRAVEVWNKLSERRAKLLGLDAPLRQEVTHLSESTVDHAIEELRQRMNAEAAAAGVEVPEDASH